MCLSIAVARPDAVLARGVHAVTHNNIAYRCGYVKVEPGHPWHGKDYDSIECEVHGGLTFAEANKGGPDNGWWVGFDCAHCGDAPDPGLPGFSSRLSAYAERSDCVRSQAYVEAQCKSLCEQAAEALKAVA